MNIYEGGKPFSKGLIPALDSIGQRVKNNKASLIIVDGGVGEGKTTLAVEIADHYNSKPIDLKTQYGMGGSDFLSKLRVCFEKKHVVIIYDEAGDFNKRSSISRFNAMLNRTFETYRAFKVIVILVLPSFFVLDADIFDKQIPRMLIHCYGRSNKYGNYKVYSLVQMSWLRAYMKKYPLTKWISYNKVEPNLIGHFKDLEPERSRELDKISTAGKIKELTKSEVKIEGLVNYKEIAQKINMSVPWVKLKISKENIKPEKIIKKTKYYSEDTISRLADLIQ